MIAQVFFRFYAGLNHFLPLAQRQQSVAYLLNGPTAVKHPIEALGIPHTEVELILAGGAPVDFGYLLQPGDRIAVYPPFAHLNPPPGPPLRPPLPQPIRFIADNHLGRLAVYLRLLSFDTLYRNDYDDVELAEVSHSQERVLLTRDRRLLMRKIVTYGYWVPSRDPREQLTAVLHRYRLADAVDPWRRCLRCNGRLNPVPKAAVLHRLEPKTKLYYHEFQRCDQCDQVYWKGSHYEALNRFLDELGLTRRV